MLAGVLVSPIPLIGLRFRHPYGPLEHIELSAVTKPLAFITHYEYFTQTEASAKGGLSNEWRKPW